MGKVIGIDLGTTNSVAAIRKARVEVLQNRENSDLTPSVVAYYKGDKLVGPHALDRLVNEPAEVIRSVKRLMGRGFRDEEVQQVREKYQYSIVAPSQGTDDDVRVVLGGEEYSPIQISALILRKIKEDAELRENDTIDSAIITVPAYFTDRQKEATRRAGQLAGLKVQKLLDEPTAAAVAFGMDNVGPDESRYVLVYDLGGGTFDVSVLSILGGSFAQLDVEGDMWLGGDDFDFKIVDHIVGHLQLMHGVDARRHSKFMVVLKDAAENAKKALSSMTRTDIIINGVLPDADGNMIPIDFELTRAQFEALIADSVAESIRLVRKALDAAGVTADAIDNVLLVGGSSSIPLVRRSLAAVFGEKKLMMNVDPMKCVAYGAATLAASFAAIECSKGHRNPLQALVCETCGESLAAEDVKIVTEGATIYPVTAMHWGIETTGGRFSTIIEKGSAYPTLEPKVKRFFTPAANLARLKVPTFAGFGGELVKAGDWQGTVWLEMPPGVPENTPLDVAFTLSDSGILDKVIVTLKDGSGAKVEAIMARPDSKRGQVERRVEDLRLRWTQAQLTPDAGRHADAAYVAATRALSQNDHESAEQEAARLQALLDRAGGRGGPAWRVNGDGLISYAEVMVTEYGWLIDPPHSNEIKRLMEGLRAALKQDNEKDAEQHYQLLDTATDSPPTVRALMRLMMAEARATRIKDVLRADKLRTGRAEIDAAIRRNDAAAVETLFSAVLSIAMEVEGAQAGKGSDHVPKE